MSGLPPELHNFLIAHFDSVEMLEVAMLLRRAPNTFWASPAVAEHLGIRKDAADAKLRALHQAGVLVRGEQTGAYRFAPASDHVRGLMDGVADAYTNRRVSVINTIYSANLERLRAFSGAFRLKDEK